MKKMTNLSRSIKINSESLNTERSKQYQRDLTNGKVDIMTMGKIRIRILNT